MVLAETVAAAPELVAPIVPLDEFGISGRQQQSGEFRAGRELPEEERPHDLHLPVLPVSRRSELRTAMLGFLGGRCFDDRPSLVIRRSFRGLVRMLNTWIDDTALVAHRTREEVREKPMFTNEPVDSKREIGVGFIHGGRLRVADFGSIGVRIVPHANFPLRRASFERLCFKQQGAAISSGATSLAWPRTKSAVLF